jgi:threonine/homoserine/homoserine lactone efflux protein
MIIIEGILVFIAVGAMSYLSNIPPGFVNVKVIETSLFRGYYSATKVALGAAIAELTYAAAALITASYIQNFPVLVFVLGIFITIILIVFAYKYFTGKTYAEQIEDSKIEFTDDNKKRNNYVYGLGLGLLNPQMFPYWFLFFTVTLTSYNVQYLSSYYIAIAGAVVGGFGLLWTYSILAAKYRRKIFSVFAKYPINQYVGWTFIILVVIQVVRLTYKYQTVPELKEFFAGIL